MSQNIKTIRWGILGLGKIAHKFADDLNQVKNSSLYAVASRSSNKSITFSKTFKAIKAYDSYLELAKDPNVDAIYIATPHALHKEHTILCLENGKAVLCEKPFAMNLNEVIEMINVSKLHGTLLMEALWTRFLPHYQYVLQLVKDKTYGEVIALEADFGFYREFDNTSRLFNKSLGGGSLLDIGIYPIFCALTILGEPTKVNAKATFYDNGVDSSCDMTFYYKNNVKAYLKSSLLEDTPTVAKIECEDATIFINRPFHKPTSIIIQQGEKVKTIDFNTETIGYNFEIEHFNTLLRSGDIESNLMPFSSSKLLIKLIDNVRLQIGLNYK
jgi:predicted dehydrogenase